MKDGWCLFVFLDNFFCFVLREGWLIRLLQEDGIVDISLSFDNDCDRQLLLLSLEVDLISKWFVMIVCSFLVENSVSVSFGNGVKFEFGCNAWWLGSLFALFLEGPVLVQPFMPFFITSVFFCCPSLVFASKIKLFILGLSFDFLLFFFFCVQA